MGTIHWIVSKNNDRGFLGEMGPVLLWGKKNHAVTVKLENPGLN